MMGYSTDITASHEPLTMVQTPANIKAARLRAGWNVYECGNACGISDYALSMAEAGRIELSNKQWQRMLTVCGQRIFDQE